MIEFAQIGEEIRSFLLGASLLSPFVFLAIVALSPHFPELKMRWRKLKLRRKLAVIFAVWASTGIAQKVIQDNWGDEGLIAARAIYYRPAETAISRIPIPTTNSVADVYLSGIVETPDETWIGVQVSDRLHYLTASLDLFASLSVGNNKHWHRLSRFHIGPGIPGFVAVFDNEAIDAFFQEKGYTNQISQVFFKIWGTEDSDADGRTDIEERLEYGTNAGQYNVLPDPPFPEAEVVNDYDIPSYARSLARSAVGDISAITGKRIVNASSGSGSYTPSESGYYTISCSADDYVSYTVGDTTITSLWTTHANPTNAVVWLDAGTTYPTYYEFEDYGSDHWYEIGIELTEAASVTTNCAPELIVIPTEIAVSKKNPVETEPTVYITNACAHSCSIDIGNPETSDSTTNTWYKKVVYTLIHDGERRTSIPCYYKYIDDKEPNQTCTSCCTEGFDPTNGCVEVRQKFGRTPHIPGLPTGRVVILETTPTARLASNACIKYDHPMMREIVRFSGYDAIIKNGLGETVEYKDGRPAGFSSGLDSQFYHDGTNYIERISADLEVIYVRKKAAYLKPRFGKPIPIAELGITVNRDEKGHITSIESIADGTISYQAIEGNEDCLWRLVWMSPSNSPVKTFTFSGNGYDDVLLEEKRNEQFVFNYRWTYDESLMDWCYTKGMGGDALRMEKRMSFNDDTQSWEILEETVDTKNNVIASFASTLDMSGKIPAVTSRTSGDDDLYSATREENGFVASETNNKGHTTSYTRDRYGRILSERTRYADSLDKETTYRYAFGPKHNVDPRPIEKVVRIGGLTVEHEFCVYEANRSARIRAFGSGMRASIVEYDDFGREILSVQENGRARQTEYTSLNASGGWTETISEGVWRNTAFALIPGKSTRRVRHMSAEGNATNIVEYAYVDGSWHETASRSMTYDVAHRVTSTTYSDGRSSAAEWICTGAVWERDTEGIVTSNEYNSVKALARSTRFGPHGAVQTSCLYDAAGRVTNEVQCAEGCVTRVCSLGYDSRGRIAWEVGFDGVGITHTYSEHDRVHTKTYSDGSTEITTVNTDGTLASITGTAVVPRYYTYDISPLGEIETTVHYGSSTSPKYETTIRNAYGEVTSKERSGYNGSIIVTTNVYDSVGRLIFEGTTGEPEKRFVYDDWGDLRSVSESADGASRITEYQDGYCVENDIVYRGRNETRSADGCADVQTASRYEQISGLSLSEQSRQLAIDKYGTRTESLSSFDPSSSTRRIEIASDMVSNCVSQVLVDGKLVESVSESAVTNRFEYNAYGWRTAAIDGRGNRTTYEYDHRGNLIRETDAAGGVISRGYDTMNRLVAVTNEVGNVTRYEYDAQGRKTYEGGATYPVRYAYDIYGNRVTMTTYRNEASQSGDTTTWVYDVGSGLVIRKVYADGNGPSYTYTPEGKLSSRTWARGIVTNYVYDGWGNLISTTYSDDTPAITYSYDALGRVTSASDVSGTAIYTYNEKGDETEIVQTGLVEKTLSRHYDDYGRNTGYSLEGTRQITVGYDGASGRIASADIGGIAHTWSYLEGSDLKSRLDYGTIGSAEWSYEPNRDLLTQVKNSAHGRVISQYDYTNDAAGRRVSKNNELYGYNERSELISATGNGNYSYVYDDIGNRISSIEPDNSFSYSANSLNQYTGISAVNLNLEPQPFIPQYDLDGNQTLIKTKTGIWSVTYNGENRPIDWTCGATNIVMKYDRMGRRVEYLETVSDLVDATITTNKHQHFVYDNYLCVERLDASNTNAVTDVFVWDPTEPIATRPLQWQTSSNTYAYFHDGNKNVTDVMALFSSGGIVAHYEYSPFGEILSQVDSLCSDNPLRFSSEYEDNSLHLSYYIFRCYDWRFARWVARDRAGETVGKNLYFFSNNNPVCFYDRLGERTSLENCNYWVSVVWGETLEYGIDADILYMKVMMMYDCKNPKPICICDSNKKGSGFHDLATGDIYINAAHISSYENLRGTVLHEMQHRKDKCAAGDCYDTSCEARAKREVRAYLRSGKFGEYLGKESSVDWASIEEYVAKSLNEVSSCKNDAGGLARRAVEFARREGERL